MGRSSSVAFVFWALLLAAPAGADEAESPAPVGHVTNLTGNAAAERPGEAPRPLGCRDAVYAGERVVTSDDSSVGVLMDDVYALVGEESVLHLDTTPERAADLDLERGAVRVLDPREAGSEAKLGVLGTTASIVGNDAEAYVFTEKAGAYGMFCEWDTPLSVARADESAVADSGQCVISKQREPLYLAQAHEQRLGSPGDAPCALLPLVGALDHHLDPAQVAAGPLGDPWSDVAAGVPMPPRGPCDVPGSGCAGIFEPPATPGAVPGGAGTFTGP